MAKEPSPTKFKRVIIGYREVVLRVFSMLLLFFICIIIYKRFDPFSWPGIEHRTLFVLIPLGLITLALYFPYGWAKTRLKKMLRHRVSQTLQYLFSPVASRLGTFVARIVSLPLLRKAVTIIFLALLVLIALEAVFSWEFLQKYQTLLIIASIASGALALWLNKEKIDLKSETEQEELEEAKRKREFGKKFSRINRIPVVRWFIRWMYKEGWGYSSVLLSIISVGTALRLWQLGNIGFQFDEILHAVAANSIETTGLPYMNSDYLYWRGLVLNYFSAFVQVIFGKSEFCMRLPIAICGILLIFISYTLGKKFNKKIGLIFASLISFDIWFIEFSRYLRFYMPLLTVYGLMLLLSFVYFRKQKSSDYILLIFLMCLTCLFTDAFSVFINLFISSTFLLVFIYKKIGIQKEITIGIKQIIPLIAIVLLTYLIYNLTVSNPYFTQPSELGSEYTNRVMLAFFNFTTDNYGVQLSIGLIALIFVLYSIFSVKKRSVTFMNKTMITSSLVIILLETVGILFYISLSNFNFTVRPLLFLVYIMTFIFSVSVYYLISSFRIRHRIVPLVVLLVLIIFLITQSLQFLPSGYGKNFHPYKVIAEKQPIVIDTKTTALYVRDLIQKGDKHYFVISVTLNPLFDYYYLEHPQDALVRWDTSLKDENNRTLFGGVRLYTTQEQLMDLIYTNMKQEKNVVVIAYATIYPIKNKFYLRYFGTDYKLEASNHIYQFLEKNNDKVVYWGKDGISRVYLFNSNSEVNE